MTRGFPETRRTTRRTPASRLAATGWQPVFRLYRSSSVKDEKPFFVWYAPFLAPHAAQPAQSGCIEKYLRPRACQRRDRPVLRHVRMVRRNLRRLAGAHRRLPASRENTLVIYVTDNGWIQTDERQLRRTRSKRSPNEGGTRTPIMFRWPGEHPGGRSAGALLVHRHRADDPRCCRCRGSPQIATRQCRVRVPRNALYFRGSTSCPKLKSGKAVERDALFGESFAHDIADIETPAGVPALPLGDSAGRTSCS